MQFGYDFVEGSSEDQGVGAGIAQDEREFVGYEPPVEGHDYTTGFSRPEEDFDEVAAVHQQGCHSVALGESVVSHAVGDLVAALVQLHVGLAFAAGDINDGFCCGIQQSAFGYEQSDVVFHCDLASWLQIRRMVGPAYVEASCTGSRLWRLLGALSRSVGSTWLWQCE